jgi:hypothetical protein
VTLNDCKGRHLKQSIGRKGARVRLEMMKRQKKEGKAVVVEVAV